MIESMLVFIVAAATDGIDGHLARSMNEVTKLGAILDTNVDKGLILGTLWVLACCHDFPIMPVILITIREIGITLLRFFMEWRGLPLPVDIWGKVKAWIQYVGIALILLLLGLHQSPWFIQTLLWITCITTVVSGLHYVRKAFTLPTHPK